jgi:hypothetical protein
LSFFFSESELSVADASEQLAAELQQRDSDRDVPRMNKLWDHLFESRRRDIARISDGCVKEILNMYPLLNQLKYVSIAFFIISNSFISSHDGSPVPVCYFHAGEEKNYVL